MKRTRRKGRWQIFSKIKLDRIMKCLRPDNTLLNDRDMTRSPMSITTEGYSNGVISSCNGIEELKVDTGNIEEAESSLRERGRLNDEEARALMGRLEYQRGNVEAALRLFDGIDISAIGPKMKMPMVKKAERRKTTRSYAAPPMSMHAISLLFEASFLKAKSLQCLERYKDAALSCNIILDTVESAFPEGLPLRFSPDCKLQEIICKSVELLPELWKLAGFFHEATLSYRRAILNHWNLDQEALTKVYKEFAMFLLYGGTDVMPPNPQCHIEGSFIPRNNIEEAILLLIVLLRKFALKEAKWDLSIIDHLILALSLSGNIEPLAKQIEEILPGVLDRKERYYILALCYLGKGDYVSALNLLKKKLRGNEDPKNTNALLLASKICAGNIQFAEEGVSYARRTLESLPTHCDSIGSVANLLLGVNLSTYAKASVSDSERNARQGEALQALNKAEKLLKREDCNVIYFISIENAEQRKLVVARRYAELLLRIEAGSNIKGWLLLARILTAQQCLTDAEIIVNAALEQTGNWDQAELLLTKARIQIAQGNLKSAIETYTNLLAILQLTRKHLKGRDNDTSLEMKTWHDLANVYTIMSHWNDAEVCLSKLKMIEPFSASRWHATGKLFEAKGLLKEAKGAYQNALEISPDHVPSLVSIAACLNRPGDCPFPVVKNYLTSALRIDRTNHDAWYNLGRLYKAAGGKLDNDAVECFQAAAALQESAPVEPFR